MMTGQVGLCTETLPRLCFSVNTAQTLAKIMSPTQDDSYCLTSFLKLGENTDTSPIIVLVGWSHPDFHQMDGSSCPVKLV